MQVQLNNTILNFPAKVAADPAVPVVVTPPLETRSLIRRHPALMLALSGFAVGCGFWYAVGALDLVMPLFQPKSKSERIAAAQSQSASQYDSKPTNVGLLTVKITSERCTTLELDRSTGKSTVMPCLAQSMPLKSLVAARKGDRRIPMADAKAAATVASTPAVAGWSATVKTATSR
jgi:hypothetical protein